MPVNASELRLFAELAKQAAENPSKPLSEMTITEARAGAGIFLTYAGQAASIPYKDIIIPARDGYKLSVRIYNPDHDNTKPVFIMYPGSGYACDTFKTNRIAASRVADYGDIKVIMPEYRLAPEFPLPIPLYDAFDVFKYVALHPTDFNIDPDNIIIGGLSSGAHAATVVSNLARQEQPPLKDRHQILLNGSYYLLRSHRDYDAYEAEDKILTEEAYTFFYSHWGIPKAQWADPLYSPYYETNFAGLPSKTIMVGEYDGLRGDSEAYYHTLKQAGVAVERILLPGQTHNTMIMRDITRDDIDPARVIADIINKHN